MRMLTMAHAEAQEFVDRSAERYGRKSMPVNSFDLGNGTTPSWINPLDGEEFAWQEVENAGEEQDAERFDGLS